MPSRQMKFDADALNEVHDIKSYQDQGRNRVTPVIRLPSDVALAIVDALAAVVRKAHALEHPRQPDANGIVRAQTFEEGNVYMLDSPFDGFLSDRYLMDFYDVDERNLCSRMHLHTGPRFVRMMTGPGTRIRVSSLSPIEIVNVEGVTPFFLESFEDHLPEAREEPKVKRYNLVVPENTWVDMQIPRGVSHQFNAIGPNAVIDSVHPEESIETFREQMSGYQMMAQTIFLSKDYEEAASCNSLP